MSRVGILGGSFNPIHNGHLKLAQEAMNELNLDRVIFVPSYQTPLKKTGHWLPAQIRADLVRAAVKSCPGFSVSDCEIKRKGRSFTVDTLAYFKKKLGSKTKIYFIAGQDSVQNLHQWRSIKKIMKDCCFVIMTRPGYETLKTAYPVLQIPIQALDVSATQIRARLASRRSIRQMVPKPAASLLTKHLKRHDFIGGFSSNPIKK